MSYAQSKFKQLNLDQPPPKVIEGDDPFNDQLHAASYTQVDNSPESVSTKPRRKPKRGDRIKKLATGEVFIMTSESINRGTFFAILEGTEQRTMLREKEVEVVEVD